MFADTDSITDPLPEPDAGLTVNHDTSDDAFHDVFEDNGTVTDTDDADGQDELEDNVNVGAKPISCVTTNCLLTDGLPDVVLNVTVPDRAAPVFAATDNFTVPLPVPNIGSTVNHAPVERTCHDVFDVTDTDTDDDAFNGDHEFDDTDNTNASPACDTRIVRDTLTSPNSV